MAYRNSLCHHIVKTTTVCAQQGLRQGCELAPLLWMMALAQIYRELRDEQDPLMDEPWMQNSTTIYADDTHLKEIMQTARELERVVYRFCRDLDALAAKGVVINSGISAILLRHRGSFVGWLRRHLLLSLMGMCFASEVRKATCMRFRSGSSAPT